MDEEIEPLHDESQDDGDWPRAVGVVGGDATPSGARRVVIVGALAGVAAAVVAASSSELVDKARGEVPAVSTGVVGAPSTQTLVTTMLVAFVGLAFAAFLTRPPGRGAEPALIEVQRRMDWRATAVVVPLLVVAVLVLGVALAAWFGEPDATTSPPTGARRGAASEGAVVDRESGSLPVNWLVFAAASSVVTLAAAALLARDWRRRQRDRAARMSETDELAAAVDESLDDLESEPDPRLVVIKAYGRMERALARAGIPRRSPETPLEYLARALAAVRVSHASITRLTSLFQQAQFSRHTIDAAMKDDAIDALRDLRAELRHPWVAEAPR